MPPYYGKLYWVETYQTYLQFLSLQKHTSPVETLGCVFMSRGNCSLRSILCWIGSPLPVPIHKTLLKETLNQISPGRTSHSIPLVSLNSIVLKLERLPDFFMFQSTSIFPSVRTNKRKQYHCLHKVLNNKTGLLFFLIKFNWCEGMW